MNHRIFMYNLCKGFQCYCEQHGAPRADVMSVATSSRLDSIKSVYGVTVASNLVKIEASDSCSNSVFNMDGFISNSNYVAKKMTMVLFINGICYILL